MISVTGSVLVYRNELYRAATPAPIISKGSGPRLTDDQLTRAVARLYPGYRVVGLGRARNLDQAVDVRLRRGDEIKHRLFDPRSASDLGDSVSTGIRVVSTLLDLHDNLLAGSTGRKANGVGALALIALAMTGLAIWWPGIKTWRRSLTLHRGLGFKRLAWHLHSMIGFWSLGFTLVFALSGVYLVIPDQLQDVADWFEPLTRQNAGLRIGDRVIYWLAYLHFGRINGIGIPCSGPGLCDQTTKAIWAIFGLAPAAMFVTGTILWWNRVLRPRLRALRQPQARLIRPPPSSSGGIFGSFLCRPQTADHRVTVENSSGAGGRHSVYSFKESFHATLLRICSSDRAARVERNGTEPLCRAVQGGEDGQSRWRGWL